MSGSKTISRRQKAILIRPARESDFEILCSLDQVAKKARKRREFIRRAIASGSCFVAVTGQEIIGYGMLNYTFYDYGFINMLYVAADQRRRGAGTALLEQLERQCRTPKLFTSTNMSNVAMQSLLARHEYVLVGVIHELDEGDAEIVYSKRLR